MIQTGDAEGARRAMEYHLTAVEPENASSAQQSAFSSQEFEAGKNSHSLNGNLFREKLLTAES
jgi:hypothetical protein